MRDDLDLPPDGPSNSRQGGGSDAQADGVGTEAAQAEPQPSGRESEEQLQEQLQEQRDKYLRLAAEFDNFRKRTARERQEAGTRAQGDLMRRFLDSLDDLGRVASVNADAIADPRTIIEGVEAVQRKLLKALSDAGLEVIDPVDQPFNPQLHEAVATEPALSPEDDHLVARVYQPGYLFQGQLLRPARVVVKQWMQ
ncbi:MAG TPA: nucleotide exchange factor GrpE [Gemmatimonadaceae bacterium]|nr:nucleotide exchange factor GrpE [Gemmatimonadaceae bacterium]